MVRKIQPITAGSAFAAILCAAIWSGQSVAVKVALQDFPANTMMALRFLLPIPLLLIAARWKGLSIIPQAGEWKTALANAALLCCQITLFTYGTDLTTSSASVILINTFPFFAAFAGHFFLPDHKLNIRTVMGILVAFSGIPILFGFDGGTGPSGSWTGKLLILGAAFFMGSKVIFMKRTLSRLHPLKLTLWDVVTAAVLFSILALTTDDFEHLTPHTASLIGLAYQAWIVSFVGFIFWLSLLARHSANDLNVFRLLTPPIGVLLGGLILGEPLSFQLVTCAVVVTFGLYLVLTSRKAQLPDIPISTEKST